MARDTVTVDGVTLTRAQVEKALEQLNARPKINPGDVVTWNGSPRVICVNDTAIRQDGGLVSQDYVREYVKDGGYKRIGTLSEIVAFYREAKGL